MPLPDYQWKQVISLWTQSNERILVKAAWETSTSPKILKMTWIKDYHAWSLRKVHASIMYRSFRQIGGRPCRLLNSLCAGLTVCMALYWVKGKYSIYSFIDFLELINVMHSIKHCTILNVHPTLLSKDCTCSIKHCALLNKGHMPVLITFAKKWCQAVWHLSSAGLYEFHWPFVWCCWCFSGDCTLLRMNQHIIYMVVAWKKVS